VAVAAATAAPASTRTRLRSDIFEALTRIPKPGERALYLPESDAVLWLTASEVAPANAVSFPEATFEAEVDLRRRFAEQEDKGVVEGARDALRQALSSDGPLRDFTHAIRSYGLIQDWHLFRMGALSEKLREWVAAHGLTFNDEWLGSDEPKSAPAAALAAVAAGNKRGLVELAGVLSEDDISRISVPLDVVLRLLAMR